MENKPRGGQRDSETVVAGRNAVLEALKGGALVEKIYILRGERQGSVVRILAMAKERHIPVAEADRVKLDHLAGSDAHQGIVATLREREYCSVEDMLAEAERLGEPPLLILCDGLEDPHNLGAILRTAEVAGAHGVIIPKHRSVGMTPAVTKASAGAVFHVNIARVTNLARTMEELKERGVWLYGTVGEGGQSLFETDLAGPVGIVVGSEGEGISRLVQESCDHLISIPMKGRVGSLNASVAAGIVLYEVVRQRGL